MLVLPLDAAMIAYLGDRFFKDFNFNFIPFFNFLSLFSEVRGVGED